MNGTEKQVAYAESLKKTVNEIVKYAMDGENNENVTFILDFFNAIEDAGMVIEFATKYASCEFIHSFWTQKQVYVRSVNGFNAHSPRLAKWAFENKPAIFTDSNENILA